MDVEIVDWKGVELIQAADVTEGNDNVSPLSGACDVSPAHARATWERFRRQGRAAGMSRKESVAYATREVEKLHPPPPGLPPLPPVVVEPDPLVVVEPPAAPETPPASTEGGLAGLGDLPAGWPSLPSNATLQVEVAWVQANRLRVYQGNAVDLSRALSPAPSHSALAWLETAILFPAKWADVTVKATQNTQDDQELVRRERGSLVDVRSLLSESTAG